MMPKKTIAFVALIVAIGLAAAAIILRTPPAQIAVAEGGEGAGLLNYPRGPHGARLLEGDALQLEMTIYETGVRPQLRVYPYDAAKNAIPPRDVTLSVELHRVGGRVDRITFTPEADYLRGNEVVEEPHSFDVQVSATHGGRQHTWSYSQIEGKVELGPDQVISAGMSIETVGPREMSTFIELPGEVKADDTRVARVVPRLQGVIDQVLKKEGDRVRKGEVMAVISSRELADAKRDYIEAAHDAEYRATILQREVELFKKKISAEQDLRLAEKLAEEAQLATRLAAQKLIVLGVPAGTIPGLATAPADTIARYEIRSPLDGVVLERQVTTGEAVAADANIFTVGDLSSIWVDVSVYAKDLGTVKLGQTAAVSSTDLDRSVDGTVSYIGPLVGQESRTAVARIVLPNRDGQWRPGLFVKVRVVRESTTVPLAVKTDGVQTFRDWQVVFVKYGNWFEARPLELGRSDGEWVEVRSGLKAGDQYVSTNSFAVKAEIGKLGATHDH